MQASQITNIQNSNDSEEHVVVSKWLKICINCGYDDIDKTEFCVSCENCGMTAYFD